MYRSFNRAFFGFGLVFCILALLLPVASGQGLPGKPQQLPSEPLSIESAGGNHAFIVEIADDVRERSIGMMFRVKLDADRGMLFDYPEVQDASFWMKNTYIPLDLVFIRADGSIANIAADAVPLSLVGIPSDGEIRGVLEIQAGLSARLGIKPGDIVHHRIFGNTVE